MSRKGLSHDMALRIALAAGALPDVSVQLLVDRLIAHFGMPLTAKKFASLTVADLANLLEGKGSASDVEQAAGLLRGDLPKSPQPDLEPFEEGDMPHSIRVAVASNGGEMLNGHFASCESFLIYQVAADEVRLIDSCPTASAADEGDKTAALVNLISDCHVLFVVSVGGPAAAKVVKAGIHPIKRPKGGPAREELAELQSVLAGSPPPWLAKVLGVVPEERIRIAVGGEA
jgi:nitrogen fixation protein NifX